MLVVDGLGVLLHDELPPNSADACASAIDLPSGMRAASRGKSTKIGPASATGAATVIANAKSARMICPARAGSCDGNTSCGTVTCASPSVAPSTRLPGGTSSRAPASSTTPPSSGVIASLASATTS
ncbi:MAG: hypothetical protein M5U28_43410 [Sandaracinaceae bacterium]|nr:hypothetical protein [Sandaracinaceae bacterium]